MNEIWKDVVGFEGLYQVSNFGGMIRLPNRRLYGNLNSYGYRVIKLTNAGRQSDHKLHRLVAKAFIPNPNNYRCVNHKDGNKDNNFVDNLEWCTHGMNNYHARNELDIDFSRKTVVQSTLAGKMVAVWASSKVAALILNGSEMMIAAACKGTAQTAYGYKWKYLTGLLDE